MSRATKSKRKGPAPRCLSLYISPEMQEQIRDRSAANRRSVSSEVEVMLERVLNESAAKGEG